MNRAWIAAILAFCLVIVVGALAAGGILAATAGRDLSPAAATMIATIAGGILAAVATYIGGKDYAPPPAVVADEPTDATPPPAGPEEGSDTPLVADPVDQEPVEQFASADESYGGVGRVDLVEVTEEELDNA